MKLLRLCSLLSAALLLFSCGKEIPRETIVRIHGSNTIGADLMPEIVQKWLAGKGAEEITVVKGVSPEEKQIYATLNKKPVAVEIHSYGSSTGFSDLKAGKCDIGMSSKPIPEKNAKDLENLGDMLSPKSEHIIALDGIAIIVNPDAPIEELDLPKIKQIFLGEISNWNQLGGDDAPIMIYRRDNNSGTHEVFKKLVMNKEKLADNANVSLDNNELVASVKNNPYAIGYASVTFTGDTKKLTILDDAGTAFEPSTFSVQTEDYPLSRRLYLYTASEPTNVFVSDIVEFALSRYGQDCVDRIGFVPQTIKLEKPVLFGKAPTQYLNDTENALRFSMNFRFIPGTARLDNRSFHDLKRLAQFIESEKLGTCSLKLFGFSDNRGDYHANMKLSYHRAKAVGKLIQEQTGIDVSSIKGYGQSMPVADNNTVQGREKNRRVEVWMNCNSEG